MSIHSGYWKLYSLPNSSLAHWHILRTERWTQLCFPSPVYNLHHFYILICRLSWFQEINTKVLIRGQIGKVVSYYGFLGIEITQIFLVVRFSCSRRSILLRFFEWHFTLHLSKVSSVQWLCWHKCIINIKVTAIASWVNYISWLSLEHTAKTNYSLHLLNILEIHMKSYSYSIQQEQINYIKTK